jgi:uncharacterized protein related to proFAR isomerase
MTLDQFLQDEGVNPIVSFKDTRLIQLENLRLVSIQILAANLYNIQEATLSQEGQEWKNLDIDALAHRIQVLSLTAEDKSFSVKWHLEDVHSVVEGLTDLQAEQVLVRAIKTHDSDNGINWEVLRQCAQHVLEK